MIKPALPAEAMWDCEKNSEHEIDLVYRDTVMPKRDHQYLQETSPDDITTQAKDITADKNQQQTTAVFPGKKTCENTTGSYNSTRSHQTRQQRRGVRSATTQKIPHKFASATF